MYSTYDLLYLSWEHVRAHVVLNTPDLHRIPNKVLRLDIRLHRSRRNSYTESFFIQNDRLAKGELLVAENSYWKCEIYTKLIRQKITKAGCIDSRECYVSLTTLWHNDDRTLQHCGIMTIALCCVPRSHCCAATNKASSTSSHGTYTKCTHAQVS